MIVGEVLYMTIIDELQSKIRAYMDWLESQRDEDGYLDPFNTGRHDAFDTVLDWIDEIIDSGAIEWSTILIGLGYYLL